MARTRFSPFAENLGLEETDHELITKALTGDRTALETLCVRHQHWVYNIAFRMILVPEDAEDVTQEILIKMITKLSTFDSSKAAFRTWLYRIVANHVINMKKAGNELYVTRFDDYYSAINSVPDENPDSSPEMQAVISDIMVGCVQGALLCLDRKPRLAFILTVVFNVSSTQGSELLGMTKVNFRKTLSRARERLHHYMHGNCGVVNPNASCRCHKKAKGFMGRGWHTPDKITFSKSGRPKIREVVLQQMDRSVTKMFSEYAKIFQEHPFYESSEMTGWLRRLLDSDEFRATFQFK